MWGRRALANQASRSWGLWGKMTGALCTITALSGVSMTALAQLPPANVGPNTQSSPTPPNNQTTTRPAPRPSAWRQRFVRLDDNGGVFELRYRPPGERRTLLRARCAPASGKIDLVINPPATGETIPARLIFANKISAGLLGLEQTQSGVEGTRVAELGVNHDLWFSIIKGSQLKFEDPARPDQLVATLSLRGSAGPVRAFLTECVTPSQGELQSRLQAGVPASDARADRIVRIAQPEDTTTRLLPAGEPALAPQFADDSTSIFQIPATRCSGTLELTRDQFKLERQISFCSPEKLDRLDLTDLDIVALAKTEAGTNSANQTAQNAPSADGDVPVLTQADTGSDPTSNEAQLTDEETAEPAIISAPAPPITDTQSALQLSISDYTTADGAQKQALNLVEAESARLVAQAICLPQPSSLLAQTGITEMPTEQLRLLGTPIMVRLAVPVGRKPVNRWDDLQLSANNYTENIQGLIVQVGESETKEVRLLSSTHHELWQALSDADTWVVQLEGLGKNSLDLPRNTASLVHQFLQSCRVRGFDGVAQNKPGTLPENAPLDSCNLTPLFPTPQGIEVQVSWHNMYDSPVQLVGLDAARNTVTYGNIQPGHLTSFAFVPGTPVRLVDNNNQCIAQYITPQGPATFFARQQTGDDNNRYTRHSFECDDNQSMIVDFDTSLGTAYVSRAGFEPFQEVSHPQSERYINGDRELIGDGRTFELKQNGLTLTRCTQLP